MTDQNFQVGDKVKWGGAEGVVTMDDGNESTPLFVEFNNGFKGWFGQNGVHYIHYPYFPRLELIERMTEAMLPKARWSDLVVRMLARARQLKAKGSFEAAAELFSFCCDEMEGT